MATMTLTKAGRLQDRIRAAIRARPLRTQVTVGIFAPQPGAAVEREATKLREDIDALERLLAILASLRATTGRANAECGISGLLAEQAALNEEISLIAKLVPREAARGGGLDAMFGAARQLRYRHAGEIDEQVSAMRSRFEHAEETETTLEAPLLDEADVQRLSARILARRRRLEEIGDRLRQLNGTVHVEVDDASLDYLREHDVI